MECGLETDAAHLILIGLIPHPLIFDIAQPAGGGQNRFSGMCEAWLPRLWLKYEMAGIAVWRVGTLFVVIPTAMLVGQIAEPTLVLFFRACSTVWVGFRAGG